MAGRLQDATHRTNGHRPHVIRSARAEQATVDALRVKRRIAQLSAAGRKIDVTTRDGRKLLRNPDAWQETLWEYYDMLPEVKFAGRFMGNSLSRIRLYPGVLVDPDEEPVPMDKAVDDPEIGLPEAVAQICEDETERLSASSDGMAGIMRGFGENLTLPGECYLLGRAATEDDPVLGDEYWQVYSTSALVDRDDQIMIRETPKGRPVPLAPNADPVLFRIWRRHARWPGLADSNMSACLDECELLAIYGRLLRSIGRSATMAGLLKLPIELEIDTLPVRAMDPGGGAAPIPDPDGSSVDTLTALERALMESWVSAAETEGSPAAVASFLLRGKAEHLAEAKFEIPNRPIDDHIIERMRFLIERLAHGADLPVEVLQGIADANHWTGWQIEDSTYKAHVEPTAQIPASALTSVFLRPALQEHEVSPEWVTKIRYGLDASALVVRPNRSQDAQDVFDAMGLSWDALRRYRNFPESDAPTPQELVVRAALAGNPIKLPGTVPVTATSPAVPPAVGPGQGPPGPDGQAPQDGGPPAPADGQDGATPPQEDAQAARARLRALVAASRVIVPQLGVQLMGIESRLRDRLQTAASADLRDAMRKAGSRLKSAAQGDPQARRQVNGVAPEDVGQTLGPDRAREIAEVDDLLDGAFERLHIQWDAWVPSAEADGITAVGQAADAEDATVAFDAHSQESDNEAGWTALFLGLMALARQRLFAAIEDEDGEALDGVTVPAGLVRDALAVAGGGQAGVAPHGPAAAGGPPGLMTGPRWRDALQQLDLVPNSWQWHTGLTTRPFPPHSALAGVSFKDWQDDQLVNGAGFPHTSHHYPGDHRGCVCDVSATFTKSGGSPAGNGG